MAIIASESLGIFGQRRVEKVAGRKEGRKGMRNGSRNLWGLVYVTQSQGGAAVYAVLFLNLTTG